MRFQFIGGISPSRAFSGITFYNTTASSSREIGEAGGLLAAPI